MANKIILQRDRKDFQQSIVTINQVILFQYILISHVIPQLSITQDTGQLLLRSTIPAVNVCYGHTVLVSAGIELTVLRHKTNDSRNNLETFSFHL